MSRTAADRDQADGILPATDFDRFYGEYFPRVRSYVRKHHPLFSADDVAQETLARAWRDREHINPNRPVASYLLTVARNIARDIAHRQRMESQAQYYWLEPMEGERPEERAVINEEHRLAAHAVDELDQSSRDVLILTHWAGLDSVELAQFFGIATAAARQRYSRALKRCRTHLERLIGIAIPALAGLSELLRSGRRYLATATASVAGAGAIALTVGFGIDEASPEGAPGTQNAVMQPALPSTTAAASRQPDRVDPAPAHTATETSAASPFTRPSASRTDEQPAKPHAELSLSPGTGPGEKEAHSAKVPMSTGDTPVVEGNAHADGPASVEVLCDVVTSCLDPSGVTTEHTP